ASIGPGEVQKNNVQTVADLCGLVVERHLEREASKLDRRLSWIAMVRVALAMVARNTTQLGDAEVRDLLKTPGHGRRQNVGGTASPWWPDDYWLLGEEPRAQCPAPPVVPYYAEAIRDETMIGTIRLHGLFHRTHDQWRFLH